MPLNTANCHSARHGQVFVCMFDGKMELLTAMMTALSEVKHSALSRLRSFWRWRKYPKSRCLTKCYRQGQSIDQLDLAKHMYLIAMSVECD